MHISFATGGRRVFQIGLSGCPLGAKSLVVTFLVHPVPIQLLRFRGGPFSSHACLQLGVFLNEALVRLRRRIETHIRDVT